MQVGASIPASEVRGVKVFLMVCVALLLAACGGSGDKKAMEPEEPVVVGAELLGQWSSSGIEPQLGPVDVLLSLEEEGQLRLTLLLEGGGRLSFPGTWSLVGEELHLFGEYFAPQGSSRVRWTLDGDRLLLEDDQGQVQEWRRSPVQGANPGS
jgi:hypothetical protein